MKTLELKTFGVLLFLSAVVFFFDSRGLLDLPKSLFQTVVLPAQGATLFVKQTGEEAFSFLTFWKSGENRIKNLELRNLELIGYENRAKALEAENAALREQLGVASLSEQRQLPAPVLGLTRYLEIGVGSNDGVRVGQTVVYLDNLVGKVIRTTPRAAFVQLPTDPQAKVPAAVGRSRGLVMGQFNSSIILDRIAQTEDISANDLVVTSGEGESFLPNLVVGKVGQITSAGTDLFKKAVVTPVINYAKLSLVFVLVD